MTSTGFLAASIAQCSAVRFLHGSDTNIAYSKHHHVYMYLYMWHTQLFIGEFVRFLRMNKINGAKQCVLNTSMAMKVYPDGYIVPSVVMLDT